MKRAPLPVSAIAFLRLSIGIEALEDLQNDLQAALDRVVALQEETDRGIGMSLANASANISPLAKQTTIALLGTGIVGSAFFVPACARLQKTSRAKNFRLVQVSNTRHSLRDFLGLDQVWCRKIYPITPPTRWNR